MTQEFESMAKAIMQKAQKDMLYHNHSSIRRTEVLNQMKAELIILKETYESMGASITIKPLNFVS